MSADDFLRRAFVGLEVNEDFTEAVLRLDDGSWLHLCHRVGQRTVKADGGASEVTMAAQVLAHIATFRLNGKHLDVSFNDGSCWEARFRDAGRPG
jgi:hypothetical protein